tara:strand:+ start:10481 stop:11194 length:714 start_codon:yes stop_codon:yes gene_type:complete
MYQLNPAPIDSTKETSLPKKNIKESFNNNSNNNSNNNNNNNNNNNSNNNNRTYKNRKAVNFSQDENFEDKTKLKNMNNLLSKLHENEDEDEDDDEYNNFNVAEKTTAKTDSNTNTNKDLINSELQKMNTYSDNNINNNSILGTSVNSKYSNFQDSYKSNLQYLNNVNNKQSFNNPSPSSNYDNNQLVTKLNYIIHLLEEQHNEKTNHITEELILYLFLGIFIIFVLDSFARASKYIR